MATCLTPWTVANKMLFCDIIYNIILYIQLKGKLGTWQTDAAKELFESPNQKKDESKWRCHARPVSMSMEIPLQTPSISDKTKPMQNITAAKVEDKSQQCPGNAWGNKKINTQSMVDSTAATQTWVVRIPAQVYFVSPIVVTSYI